MRREHCDHCNTLMNEGEGFAFFSDASMRNLVIGSMVICGTCTDSIITDASFTRSSKYSKVISDPDLLNIINEECIIRICKEHGFSPAAAKNKARKLALAFYNNPDRSTEAAMDFWVSRPKATSSKAKRKQWWEFW